jgi:flagellar biosynthesis GTPase FlhF
MNLQEIQKNLKAPKNQFNSFGKYKYRSCEDILEAVKPLLGESALVLSDEVVNVGDRNYVKATAVFNDGAKTISCSAFACESHEKKGMDAAQITGSASSYARKYALNGLFLIDDTKDADTMGNTVTLEEAKARMKKAKTSEELTDAYNSLPKELKENNEIIEYGKELRGNIG